jgi:hypothetical protein
MRTDVRRQLEAAIRALEFSRAYPPDEPGVQGVIEWIQECVARADVLIRQQRSGNCTQNGAVERQRDAKRRIQLDLLPYLRQVVEVVATATPGVTEKFSFPSGNLRKHDYLVSLTALLSEAGAWSRELLAAGFSASALEDLRRAVAELEEGARDEEAGRREHEDATAELVMIGRELVKAMGILDGANRHRFRGNLEVLAQWESISRRRKGRRHREVSKTDPGPDNAARPSDRRIQLMQ